MGIGTCSTRQHGIMSWSPADQHASFDSVVVMRDNALDAGPVRAEQSACAAYHSTGNWRHSSVEQSTASRNARTAATTMNQRVDPYEAAGAGAARQFKKALFGSSRVSPSPVPNELSANHQAVEPDYGDYAKHSSEYGMHASCPSRRHYNSGRQMGGSSSHNQQTPAADTTKQPANEQQQLHTSRPGVAVSTRSIHSGPPAVALRQQSGPGLGACTDTSAKGKQQQQQQCGLETTHKKILAPDYGVYGDSDDYGADLQGSRRSRAPHNRPRQPRQLPERRQHAAVAASSAEHQAVNLELAALRAALEEAEARQVEAQLAVITLETDNTTLQAQLQGMRQQKQQLETMLLFGGDNTLDHEVCSSDGSTSSLNKESPVAAQLS